MRRWNRWRPVTWTRSSAPRPTANCGASGIPAWPVPDKMDAYVATALDMRERLAGMPFVVRENSSGEIVGCTRYFNVDVANRRLEIGHTWYSRRVQRSAINTECKLLLLTHAFEKLGASRSNSGRTGSTTLRAMRSRGSARSRTRCCATTRSPRTAAIATRSCSASSRANGRRSGSICAFSSSGRDKRFAQC